MTTLTVDGHEPEQLGEFTLWVAAAFIVIALHIGLAVAYLWLKPEPEMRAEAPAIDVAFMPATNAPAQPPSVDQPDPAPIKMDQPQEPPTDQPPPPPVQEQPPPTPTPQVEAMVPHEEPPPPPVPTPPVVVQPELPPPPPVPEEATIVPAEKPPEVAAPEKPVVVPAPSPKVMHEEKIEKREKAEKREEKADKHQAPPKSVASPGTKPMRVASAPNPGAESEGARVGRESWLSELAAHIRRYATYSAGSNKESGTAQISVTIARNGRLVSRRLASSSGSPALDQAAMAVIERAQPFPPFPASMTEAQVTKIVPLHLRPQ